MSEMVSPTNPLLEQGVDARPKAEADGVVSIGVSLMDTTPALRATPRPRRGLIRIIGSALWCLAIVMAPNLGLPWVYAFFSRICHQDPARSWSLFGSQLPVCIRCTSIYFGFFIASLFALKPRPRVLKWAIGATLAEWVLALLFVDSPVLRSLTGLLLGASAAPFVRIGIEEMLQKRQWKGREVRASL